MKWIELQAQTDIGFGLVHNPKVTCSAALKEAHEGMEDLSVDLLAVAWIEPDKQPYHPQCKDDS